MRVVVTGANGFLGAAIVTRLVSDGAHVAVVVRPGADLWRLTDIAARVEIIRAHGVGDDSLRIPFHTFHPDVVVHAAWHGVGNLVRNDRLQIDNNVLPSCRLLRIAAEAGCTTFVGLGSQAEYGPVNMRCDENMPTRPTTLYGAAKLATFHLCERLAAENDMRFAWLRMFSTYGPRDNLGWLIPYLIREFLSRRRPSLTACVQKWDYLFVNDAANAVRVIAEKPQAVGIFNVGSGAAVSLRSIVEFVRGLIDPTLPIGFSEKPYRADQVMHLEADTSRLHALGWQPRVPLHDGLLQTVEWFRRALGSQLPDLPPSGT